MRDPRRRAVPSIEDHKGRTNSSLGGARGTHQWTNRGVIPRDPRPYEFPIGRLVGENRIGPDRQPSPVRDMEHLCLFERDFDTDAVFLRPCDQDAGDQGRAVPHSRIDTGQHGFRVAEAERRTLKPSIPLMEAPLREGFDQPTRCDNSHGLFSCSALCARRSQRSSNTFHMAAATTTWVAGKDTNVSTTAVRTLRLITTDNPASVGIKDQIGASET